MRLQWLEQHLKKLLLSKKRGRPGGRGRRCQQKVHLFVCVDHVGLQTQHASFLFQEIADRSLRSHQSCQEAETFHNQASNYTNGGEGTISRGDTLSVSVQNSTESRDFQDRDKSVVSDMHKNLSQSVSSKQSANQDSDEWHSDSEANWTMIGNPLKDITQSQVLSEEEPKNIAGYNHALDSASGCTISQDTNKAVTGISAHDDVEVDSNIPLLKYGFEPPRPIEIFGTCSWNSLCLAVNSNVLQDTTGMCATPMRLCVCHTCNIQEDYSQFNPDICDGSGRIGPSMTLLVCIPA